MTYPYVDIATVIKLASLYKVKQIPLPDPDRFICFTKNGKPCVMVIYDKKLYIGYFQDFKRWLEE